MTTRTTIAEVTFARRFTMASMDRPFPPGTYEIEIDEEALNTVSSIAHRRTATRIRLPSPGKTQVPTIDQKDRDAAPANDAATG